MVDAFPADRVWGPDRGCVTPFLDNLVPLDQLHEGFRPRFDDHFLYRDAFTGHLPIRPRNPFPTHGLPTLRWDLGHSDVDAAHYRGAEHARSNRGASDSAEASEPEPECFGKK